MDARDNDKLAVIVEKMKVTKEELDYLEKLKEELSKLPSSTPGRNYIETWGDELNIRYMRGHQYNIPKILEMIQNAAKWRNEFGTDKIIEMWENDDGNVATFFKGYWPVGLLGKDPSGRYIAINNLSDIDFPVILKEIGIEKTLGYAMFLMERTQKLNPYGDSIVIMDLGQSQNPPITSLFDVNSWINGLLQYLKALAGPNDMAFPEAYTKILITRAPSMFSSVFSMIKPFLPERTKQKISTFSEKEAYDYLKKFVDDDSIPEYLGGKSKLKTVGCGGKLKKGFLNDTEFMKKMAQRKNERDILLKKMLGLEEEGSESITPGQKEGVIEQEIQLEQEFVSAQVSMLTEEEMDERKRESLRIEEATALEFLRAAIHDMKRVSVGAYTRGSWRFLPGIEILETLSDVELMEKFKNNDRNIQKMVAYLHKVAENPSLLNEPIVASNGKSDSQSPPPASKQIQSPSQKTSTVSSHVGNSSTSQKISTEVAVSSLSSSALKDSGKKDSFVGLRSNKAEDDGTDLQLMKSSGKRCGFCC